MGDVPAPNAGDLFIFAALPFDPAFDDVFHVAMVPAAQAVGLRCLRIDLTRHGGDSVEEARRQLALCTAVIADVTGANPNVLYEVGFAHALGKPTVQICSQDYRHLPFSVRNRDTLRYQPGGTYRLQPTLRSYLATLLAKSQTP